MKNPLIRWPVTAVAATTLAAAPLLAPALPAVAYADAGTESSASGDGDDSSDAPDKSDTTATTADTTGSDTASAEHAPSDDAADTAAEDESSSPSGSHDDATTIQVGDAPPVIIRSSGGALTSQDTSQSSTATVASATVAPTEAPVEEVDDVVAVDELENIAAVQSDPPHDRHLAPEPKAPHVAALSAPVHPATTDAPPAAPATTTAISLRAADPAPSLDAPQAAAATVDLPATGIAAPLETQALATGHSVLDTATRLFMSVFSSLVAASGHTPPTITTFTDLLGWARRELEYILFQQVPTASPRQLVADDDNLRIVLGTMNAQGVGNDPVSNRVPLTYDVVEAPSQGKALVTADGHWVYTPDAELAANGGTDTFTVKVTEDAFHLANLLGLPGHSTYQTVTVTVPSEAATIDQADSADAVTVAATMVAATSSSTRDFTIYNFTQYEQALVALTDTNPGDAYDDASTDNAIAYLSPGETYTLSVAYDVNDTGTYNWYGYAVFKPVDPQYGDMTYVVEGLVESGGTLVEADAKCSASGSGGGSCTPSSLTSTDNVVLLDPAGTVLYYAADEREDQNNLLNYLCDDDNATCSFIPTSNTAIEGDPVTPDDYIPVRNPNSTGTVSQAYTVTTTVAVATTWSVSNKVAVKLTKAVSDEVTGTYGQTVTDTQTYTETLTLSVPAGYQANIYYEAPLTKYAGTWKIEAGNTTWYLQGSALSSPDSTRSGDYEVDYTPIAD